MILALDLGTNCGWAIGRNGALQASGVWSLKPRPDHPGDRSLEFARKLRSTVDSFNVVRVGFETFSGFHTMKNDLAVQAYCGLREVLYGFTESRKLLLTPVHNSVLKKVTTGKGNANKEAMMKHVNQWLRAKQHKAVESHDQADAIAVLLWAMKGGPGDRS